MIICNIIFSRIKANIFRITEDPYAGHEMGVSGRFLDRPIKINQKKLRNYPYRSKKSTSFDNHPWFNNKPSVICRSCKSMIEHGVVKKI